MKTTRIFFALAIGIITLTCLGGCKKTDWANEVMGVYNGNPSSVETVTVTVARVSDKKVSLDIQYNPGPFAPSHYCFSNVTLNTATSFTINEIDACQANTAATGTGSFNSNSISFTFNEGGSDYSWVATK